MLQQSETQVIAALMLQQEAITRYIDNVIRDIGTKPVPASQVMRMLNDIRRISAGKEPKF